MKVGIVVFPGSNCDKDCFYAMYNIMQQDTYYIWHDDFKIPKGTDLIILPGGFSYGDYLRCGAIARLSPIMEQVKEFADKNKLVLGICNGFQVLTESGLLPGALIKNTSLRFICQDVYLKPVNVNTVFSSLLMKEETLKIPIAHGEGNYFIDEAGWQQILENEQIVFQYASKQGLVNDENNPNGSMYNIAGIINKKGNVLGMMPHPERAVEELLYSKDGIKIFASIIKSL